MKKLIIIILLSLLSNFAHADEIDDLIPHIIQVESGGDSNALSEAGCIGVMQIGRSALAEYNHYVYKGPTRGNTCRNSPDGHVYGCIHINWEGIKIVEYDEQALFIPDINIKIGTWYLRRLKEYYLRNNYTIERLLAAYNGGITRLRNNNYDISKMPRETRNYVKKVMRLYEKTKKKENSRTNTP